MTALVLDRAWIRRPLWQIGLGAALLASVANVALYVLARAAGVPLELTEVFEDHVARMPVQNFVFATLLDGGATAIVLAAACRRWAEHPQAAFVALTVIGTLASFAFPLTSDATTASMVVLSISHVVAALIIVPPLTLALRQR